MLQTIAHRGSEILYLNGLIYQSFVERLRRCRALDCVDATDGSASDQVCGREGHVFFNNTRPAHIVHRFGRFGQSGGIPATLHCLTVVEFIHAMTCVRV